MFLTIQGVMKVPAYLIMRRFVKFVCVCVCVCVFVGGDVGQDVQAKQ